MNNQIIQVIIPQQYQEAIHRASLEGRRAAANVTNADARMGYGSRLRNSMAVAYAKAYALALVDEESPAWNDVYANAFRRGADIAKEYSKAVDRTRTKGKAIPAFRAEATNIHANDVKCLMKAYSLRLTTRAA